MPFLPAFPAFHGGSGHRRLSDRAGWDIYPIGSGDKPEDIPKGTLAGLLIGQ